MAVIRCKFCKGTGRVKKVKYELDSIGQMFQSPPGYIGISVEKSRILEEHTHKVEYFENCPVCGGSGCRWKDKKNGSRINKK